MSRVDLKDKITQLVENELLTTGFEIDDIRISESKSVLTVMITMDRTTGGITMDECADWNRKIGDLVEEHGLIEGAHTIDVSSPGIDRQLKSERDFRRTAGKLVRLQYVSEEGGIRHVLCRVLKVGPEVIVFEKNKSKDNISVNVSGIVSAKLEIEYKRGQ